MKKIMCHIAHPATEIRGPLVQRFIAVVALGLAAVSIAPAPAEAASDLQAGSLVCKGEGGWGASVTSKKSFDYTFASSDGVTRGAGVEATAGIGLGANALVGGGAESSALQPFSVLVQTGLSSAAAVQTQILEYVGPIQLDQWARAISIDRPGSLIFLTCGFEFQLRFKAIFRTT